MNIQNLTTIENIELFIQKNQAVAFTVLGDKHWRYQFIQRTSSKFGYITLKRQGKNQIGACHNNGFTTIYDQNSIKLFVEMDTRHADICGHAIKKLMELAYNAYKQQE